MSKKKAAPAAGPTEIPETEQGGIGLLAQKLLVETDHGYAEIVEAIRAKYPKAKTSARSVASIACNLRKKGVEVIKRRTSKKEG